VTEPSHSEPPLEAPPPAPPPRGQTASAVAFLVLIAGLLALYGTTDRPLFTTHEARAGLCARYMLASGD